MRSKHETDDAMRTIQANSHVAAHLMSRQEWQRNAVAMAEQQRALKAAGLVTSPERRFVSPRRWAAALGGLLVRVGSTLQKAGVPGTESAMR
jgi:hypothetical protein